MDWMVNGIEGDGVNTILFGITSGLLSLVGLIAIYMSINSQQNIQKAKEYLWELQLFTLNNDVQDEKSAKKLKWIYQHYCELQKTSRSTKVVVVLTSLVLFFCGFFWTIYILYNINSLNHFLFFFLVCSLAILLSFIFLLLCLTRTDLMGNLPKPNKLFDVHLKEEGLDMSELIFSYTSIDIVYSHRKTLLVITLNTPIPINSENIKLSTNITIKSESDIKTLPPKKFAFTKGRPVTSFSNIELPIDREGNKKDLTLSLYLEDNKNEGRTKKIIIISTYKVNVKESIHGSSESFTAKKILPNSIENVREKKMFFEAQKEVYKAVIKQGSQNII